jgi:hypothetical protein
MRDTPKYVKEPRATTTQPAGRAFCSFGLMPLPTPNSEYILLLADRWVWLLDTASNDDLLRRPGGRNSKKPENAQRIIIYIYCNCYLALSMMPSKILFLLLLSLFEAGSSFSVQLRTTLDNNKSGARRWRRVLCATFLFGDGSGDNNTPSSSQPEQEQEDPILLLPLMEAQLAALDKNDVDEGAKGRLQVQIENARTAAEFGVRRAQMEFYTAFSNQDLDKMKALWSHSSHVTCIHPGMPSIEEYDAVMDTWGQIFLSPGPAFEIEPSRAKIEICGPTAICTCMEEINGNIGKMEALNVYKRESGAWKMTLHMASPILTAG